MSLLSISQQQEYDTNHVISTLLRKFSSLKRDYGEYLSLKGQLNIPMVRYPSPQQKKCIVQKGTYSFSSIFTSFNYS